MVGSIVYCCRNSGKSVGRRIRLRALLSFVRWVFLVIVLVIVVDDDLVLRLWDCWLESELLVVYVEVGPVLF